MRRCLLTIAACIFVTYILSAQVTSSVVHITTTFSSNREFYIQCVPFDNDEPSLRGIAKVYDKEGKFRYTINRGFNGIREHGNFIGLSNDGQTVIYVLASYAQEASKELKSISIYKNGNLENSLSQAELTGCDPQAQRCRLIYDNSSKVIDFEKSVLAPVNYRKVFKLNTSSEEIFLSNHSIFIYKDILYLTDPGKITHVIDLASAKKITSHSFERTYAEFAARPVENLTTYQQFEAPYPPRPAYFPNLANGDTTGVELATYLRKKSVSMSSPDYYTYKIYMIQIEAYFHRDGTIAIEKISADKFLPLDSIRAFLTTQKYDLSFLPPGLDKWFVKRFFAYFRNPSDEKALQEKQDDLKEQALARARRMMLDTLNGAYIPRSLAECFQELDKTLPVVTKNEMKDLKDRSDMIRYHMGLGTWVRNRFGLWGGSRLLKYFQDRSPYSRTVDAEGLSSLILYSYYDWLKGDTEAGLKWEKENPILSK